MVRYPWGLGYVEDEEKERKGFASSFVSQQLSKQKGKCYYCKKRFYDQVGLPKKHHKDGDRSNNKPSNLVVACVGCHDTETLKQQVAKQQKKMGIRKRKKNKIITKKRRRRRTYSIFDPRAYP